MTTYLFSNNAQTTLAGSITNVATTANLQPGAGALFPSPGAGQLFVGSFFDAATGLLTEIVHVTARSTDTITMVRAQEGTVALSWSAGDIFGNFWTAGSAQNLPQLADLQAQAGNYAADSGSANSMVVTLNPALTAYTEGFQLRVKKAASVNTGAVVINVNALGTKSVLLPNSLAVPAGYLPAGVTMILQYDGVEFITMSVDRAHGADPVVGSWRKMAGARASTTTASWTVEEIIAEVALAGFSWKGASLTLSFNGAASGANGMDTGGLPTSGDLYIYAIYNPGSNTWACLGTIQGSGATIYAGANMPSGYTASVLVSALKTDGSAHINPFTQVERTVFIQLVAAVSGGSAATPTSVSISSIVPVPAKTCGGYGNTSANTVGAWVLADAAGNGQQIGGSSTGGLTDFNFYNAACAGQAFFYKQNGGTVDIGISSYSF